MRKITANKKNRKEKGIRLESLGSNPHSKALSFLRENNPLNLTENLAKYKIAQRNTHTVRCDITCTKLSDNKILTLNKDLQKKKKR